MTALLINPPQFPMNNVQMFNANCLYGPRKYTLNGKLVNDYHRGIDLMGLNTGSEDIVSPADGKCIYVTRNDGTGCWTMVLAHGGLFDDGSVLLTKHSHCSEFYVEVGELIKRDQVVAKEGMTGNASGNHDHTETWIIPADVWQDPKTGKYYAYTFADREKYAVDPLSIYHLYPHQKAIGWNATQYLRLPAPAVVPENDGLNISNDKVRKLLQEALALLP